MRTAPAIALLIVGAALCGGMLEALSPDSERQTMAFSEVIATLGAWLFERLVTVARMLYKP